MLPSATKVKHFHRKLEEKLSPCFDFGLAIKHPGSYDWRKASARRAVNFCLMPGQHGGLSDRAQRKRSGDCIALPLPRPEADTYGFQTWASWYEEWVSKGGGEFELTGVSWTLFWGAFGRDKQQLFRAEWDNVSQRGGRAAQPHWHVDWTVGALAYSSAATSEAVVTAGGALEELPADQRQPALRELDGREILQEQGMSGLHLAMGGWHHAREHPGRWQAPLRDGAALAEWAAFTLEYIVCQLERLKPG